MRDHLLIRAELGEAQAAYNAAAQTQPEPVWRPLSARVGALVKELREALCPGAVSCARCKAMPVGLRHVRGEKPRAGVAQYRHVYEVGCVACTDGPQADLRGFGETPAKPTGDELDRHAAAAISQAVAEWNEKNTPAAGREEG